MFMFNKWLLRKLRETDARYSIAHAKKSGNADNHGAWQVTVKLDSEATMVVLLCTEIKGKVWYNDGPDR